MACNDTVSQEKSSKLSGIKRVSSPPYGHSLNRCARRQITSHNLYEQHKVVVENKPITNSNETVLPTTTVATSAAVVVNATSTVLNTSLKTHGSFKRSHQPFDVFATTTNAAAPVGEVGVRHNIGNPTGTTADLADCIPKVYDVIDLVSDVEDDNEQEKKRVKKVYGKKK